MRRSDSLFSATWVSSKWEGRAPEGHVLMRTFFGGPAGEEALDRDDDELARAWDVSGRGPVEHAMFV